MPSYDLGQKLKSQRMETVHPIRLPGQQPCAARAQLPAT
jgi:hypothetical protein